MLHLMALPTSATDRLSQLKELVNAGDAIVLLDDGVSLAADKNAMSLLGDTNNIDVYILANDVAVDTLLAQRIDAAGLLQLTAEHSASLSWYPENADDGQ